MDLSLHGRRRLPDTLRVLLEEYPPEAWEAHPGFSGLVRFWLERHMMFRELLVLLAGDAEAAVDGTMGREAYLPRLSRFGGMLVGDLHGHHGIEDHHYFPVLRTLDPRIDAGFDLLDADHRAMDGLLHRFTETANAALQGDEHGFVDLAAAMRAEVAGFDGLLERHLTDEEELIVPVILKSGGGGLE